MSSSEMSQNPPIEELPHLVVVTGLSGAGRSTALAALEDLGFYCVDNLPPQTFEAALSACVENRFRRIALGVDARAESFLTDATQAIDRLRGAYQFELLYLDAADVVLQTRFSSTRRPHPLGTIAAGNTGELIVSEGIHLERERLEPLRERATVTLDTTALSVHELRRSVRELFRSNLEEGSRLRTRFISFGFKYGAPSDCDMLFDVRFVNNPYFIPELSDKTGLELPVRDFVRAQSEAREFAGHAVEMLGFLLPAFRKEGKSYLTVGFGCTGGRHRSVALSEWVAERLRDGARQQLKVVHRDIARGARGDAGEGRTQCPA